MARFDRLLALAALMSCASGCGAAGYQGRVVRCSDRQPIAGATIQMQDKLSPERKTFGQSDGDGSYRVAVPGPGDIRQTTTAPGHQTDERELPNTPAEAEKDHDVCLWPASRK